MKGSFTGRARSIEPVNAPGPATPSLVFETHSAEDTTGTDRPHARPSSGLRLKTRLVIAMVVLVAATTGTVGVVAYHNLEAALLRSAIGRLESDVQAVAATLDAGVHDARDDVLAISGATTVEGIVRAGPTKNGIDPRTGDSLTDWKMRLASLLIAQMRAKPNYLQMRFIGVADGGRELVRVDRLRAGGPLRVVTEADLQQKGNTEYFKQTITLPQGGIYVSPIDLNREHGVVQVPHVPVLRAATPVFDDSGAVFGIVVINIAMRPFLDRAGVARRQGAQVYLVNDQGDYLIHPDPSREFGFDLGHRYRIQDEFPALGRLIAATTSTSRMVKDSSGAEQGAAIVSTQLANGPRVAAIEALPRSVLSASLEPLRMTTLGIGLAGILAATLLAVVIARSLSNPIEEMARAIGKLQRHEPVSLPTGAAGEIGVLARAFEDYVEQERLYLSALQSSYDAMYTYSLDGIVTSWNPGAERLYGYTAEEMIGQSVELIVPEEQRAERRDSIDRLCRGDNLPSLDTVLRTKSGRPIEVSIAPSLIRNYSGEPLGVLVIASDITEQRQAEKRFRLAVESSPTGMIMIRSNGIIVLINAEVERMFGYAKDELLGQSVDVLVPERHRNGHGEFRAEYTLEPESRAMGAGRDLFARRKDGSEFPVEIGLNPIPQPGEPLILASVVDISERKAVQQELERQKAELERSNADLEQFAYVASHDLKEPLRMVASYTSLLAERYKSQLDERANKYIDYAVEGAKRMQQLISDLLDFSRVGTHAKPLEPVDTNVLVAKVIRGLRAIITDNGANVTHGELPVVNADETQLGMVFQNLIGNAVKFRAERAPEVRIDARYSDNHWLFSVADNGIGIDKQYSSRIFQMFQRLHERGKYDGSGIGLAIVKKIVERHGGQVWFDSVPGEGTTFYFTVPAMPTDTGGHAP